MARNSFSKKQQGAEGERRGRKHEGSAVPALKSLKGHVRVHFKNGHSGEYNAQALQHCAPFDLNEVTRIEKV